MTKIPDEELVFTEDELIRAVNAMDQAQALDIMEMSYLLAAKIDGITINEALSILAEIGSQPDKIKRIKEI